MNPKTSRPAALLVLALLTTSPCFAHHMAVVVSKQNAVTAVTSAQLVKIFKTELKKWPDGKNIVVVLHRASAGELVTLRRLNKMSAQQWQSFVTEHKDSVKLVDTDGKNIVVVLHRASAGELVTLRRLNKMSAQQWQSFVTEHKDSVKLVDTDDEVLAYVESTPGAVGLIDVRSVTDRVTVVRVDGKVPMEDGYLPH